MVSSKSNGTSQIQSVLCLRQDPDVGIGPLHQGEALKVLAGKACSTLQVDCWAFHSPQLSRSAKGERGFLVESPFSSEEDAVGARIDGVLD